MVRLFTARIETGEFDAESQVPWVARARAELGGTTWVNSDANSAITETPQRLEQARRSADQSLVLLKNSPVAEPGGGRSPLLPLKIPHSGPYKLAVIGYYAHPQSLYLGGYSSTQAASGAAHNVDSYTGLKAAVQAIDPQAQVDYYPGVSGGTTGSALTTVDPASVAAASHYDAVVVVAGTDQTTGSEGNDRTSLALPGAQASMISQVEAANPDTVVYLETMGQVGTSSFAGRTPALLWSSYNGQRQGAALADVLLGRVSSSGHLPFTWYANASQLPPITVTVSADVTNTSRVAGATVAQLYVTTPGAPAALQRPARRLVTFQKVALAPGQTRQLTFRVRVPSLAFFDETTNRYQVGDGRYGLQLGTSSAGITQQVFVDVSGALRPVPSVVTAQPVLPGDPAQGVAQRVFFPAGGTIVPQVTVSLSDQSLVGYITRGQSTPRPAGMTVRYSSDRPGAVSVSGHGTVLHAAGAGPATITVTVTYRGHAATGHFTVDIQ